MVPAPKANADVACQVLLVRVMGLAAALAGVGVTLVIAPLGSWISRAMATKSKTLAEASDARMKLTTEVCPPAPVLHACQ